MIELAPGRFSTTIGWPMFCETLAATRRVTPSAPPPGGNPTTQLMGFDGKLPWAREMNGAASTAAAARNWRRLIGSVYIDDDWRVIRRPLALARREVDGTAGAALGERRREQREVDAQAPAALESIEAIVPPGKRFLRLRKEAKRIGEAH